MRPSKFAVRRGAEPAPSPAESGPLPTIEDLYFSYARYVAWFATRLLGQSADVEDLVQDVFVIAARGLPGLREPERVKRWLATITVRQARWRLKRQRLRVLLGLGENELALERIVTPEASPEERALLREVFQILARLPTKQRVAWSLRHMEEEPLQEVAAICGCSLSEAKRRIAAAEERIAKELGRG